MKIIFWVLVAVDTAALLLFLVLALAAAPSSHTSPLAVIPMLALPVLMLAGAVYLFISGKSPLARAAGWLLVASPVLVLLLARSYASANLKLNSDTNGSLAYFRAGPLREASDAIAANDFARLKPLLPQLDINARGFGNMTLLMRALEQAKKNPDSLEVLAALLAAHADPNLKAAQLPLEIALQNSKITGHRPVLMLLEAGANPNLRTEFGTPLFFAGAYKGVDSLVMGELIAHGADLKMTDRDGRSIVFDAATGANWHAVLTLLQHGVDYKSGKSINGESFPNMVETYGRVYGDTAGVREVLEYLKNH